MVNNFYLQLVLSTLCIAHHASGGSLDFARSTDATSLRLLCLRDAIPISLLSTAGIQPHAMDKIIRQTDIILSRSSRPRLNKSVPRAFS